MIHHVHYDFSQKRVLAYHFYIRVSERGIFSRGPRHFLLFYILLPPPIKIIIITKTYYYYYYYNGYNRRRSLDYKYNHLQSAVKCFFFESK